MKGNKFFLKGGIISGAISVCLGLIMFGSNLGYFEQDISYGGDAYTGIQNAAAEAACNVRFLNAIVTRGFAFLLISIGLIAIFYFAFQLSNATAGVQNKALDEMNSRLRQQKDASKKNSGKETQFSYVPSAQTMDSENSKDSETDNSQHEIPSL